MSSDSPIAGTDKQSSEIPAAGTQLLEFIRLELSAEAEVKRSLESRALAVIATSGVFVTLLLALVSWRFQQHDLILPQAAKMLIAAGISALLLATLGGIIVNAPSLKCKIDADHFLDLIKDIDGSTSATKFRHNITEAQTKVLITVQIQNNRKANLLMLSVGAQIAGLSLVASSAFVILF
jgi:hypothetical protein